MAGRQGSHRCLGNFKHLLPATTDTKFADGGGNDVQKISAWLLLFLVLLAGCSRTRYRQKTDADAYALLHEKVAESAWHLPSDYDLQPRPDSRLFDPSFIDDPTLPDPSPHLYAYQLPQLPERDPARFSRGGDFVPGGTGPSTERIAQDIQSPSRVTRKPLPTVALASFQENAGEPAQLAARSWLQQPPQNVPALPPQTKNASTEFGSSDSESTLTEEQKAAWKKDWLKIPANCRTRMLEFESVQNEYGKMMGHDPTPSELDQSPRFALEDIIDTASLNSREYQRQKEILYSVAMRLSLERFDYDSKFSTGGNRTAANYSHDRNAGVTVNGLVIPTSVQANKMLTTSADLLVRFSNSVIMTFSGPSGFAADVGSDLLLDISQTVFQRDARFERLTQSERDVLYAARSFRRFRKTQFSDLTTQYYNLLINYRQIEIQSHNYFRLGLEFQEQSAEARQGTAALFEVDQVEQQLLSGLSRLINACNSLERTLDNLKIRLGLPTETLINLDLTELKRLTGRDELAVTGELIGRIHVRLEADIDEENTQQPGTEQLLSSSINLLEGILDVFQKQSKLDLPTPNTRPLEFQRLRMQMDEIWLTVEDARKLFDDERGTSIAMLQRSRDLIESLLQLQERQLEFAEKNAFDVSPAELRNTQPQQEFDTLTNEVDAVFKNLRPDKLDQMVRQMVSVGTWQFYESAWADHYLSQLLNKLESLPRELIERLSQLQKRQLEFRKTKLRNALLQLEFNTLIKAVYHIFNSHKLDELDLKVIQMGKLLIKINDLALELDESLELVKLSNVTRQAISLADAKMQAKELLQLSKETQASVGGGLIPLDIEVDDAMLTGLVKRLDLITERNVVADRWRQIKLAADDLKSVLNISASQTVSTRSDVNRAFDFTFDESRTAVSATLDLPFNRRSQRNAFRQRLIDYQAALRSQMQLEDGIKLDIRNDLRSLALDQDQYAISVAGAALAYQQVASTKLEIKLNAGADSRDLLIALNEYTSRLSDVASDHIGYILHRMQLFLNLELLEVDDSGFWTELYDEGYQPEGYYQLPPEAMPAYGELPHGLMFSKEMRRMLCVPVGVATVHGSGEEFETVPAEPNAIDYPELGDALPIVPVSPATELDLPPPAVDE
jgi:outer membrane protein TolC